MAEIAFRIGDSGASRDGDIVVVLPDGLLIPAADMRGWIDQGKEPAVLQNLPGPAQRRWRRRIANLRHALSASDEELAGLWSVRAEDVEELIVSKARRDRERFLTEGADTNWGFDDLRTFGVVRVDGITHEEAVALVEGDYDETAVGPRRLHGKRRQRLKYRVHLSAAKVAELETEGLRVEVDRQTPITKTAIADEPRERV